MSAPVPASPSLPINPLIEALRDALAAYSRMVMSTAEYAPSAPQLYQAAKAVVAEYDAQMAYVKAMMETPRPSVEEIRAQLGLPAAGQSIGGIQYHGVESVQETPVNPRGTTEDAPRRSTLGP